MSEFISDWRTYLTVERGLAPATVKLYARYLETLHKDVGDPVTLSTDALRTWLHSKRGSAGTVSNRISALKGFYRYLVRSGILREDPSLPLEAPKGRSTPGGPVENLDEVLVLLDELDRRANRMSVIPRRVGESRDMAIFLAETGLRINEAVDCDWPVPCPSEVTIIRRSRREVMTVSDRAREAWDRLEGEWPIGARATQRRFEKADFHPHQLRHWHRANRSNSRPRTEAPQASSSLSKKRTLGVLEKISEQYSNEDLTVVLGFLEKLLEGRQKSNGH